MTRQPVTLVIATVMITLSVGRWAAAAHPMEGQPAPPIKLETLQGQSFSLDRVEAQVIVLDFWATWCPPCRKGLPLLQQFDDWARQNKKPVGVYTINLREKPRRIGDYWKKQGLNMPVLLDTDAKTAQSYGVRGIPQTVVIHQGKIVHVHVGFSPNMVDMLKAETENLLSEAADQSHTPSAAARNGPR